jgi:hypothetical protein
MLLYSERNAVETALWHNGYRRYPLGLELIIG